MFESLLLMPIRSQNRRIAEGGKPRRLVPEMVGILGSSHPDTCFSSTSLISLRLERTVYLGYIFMRWKHNYGGGGGVFARKKEEEDGDLLV
jgi:hypothetical protein